MNAVSARFHPLRVVDVSRETNDAVAITLQPPPQADFRFTPGQYLTFRRVVDGVEQRRSYSICSGLDDGTLRVGIKRVAGGVFSGWAVDHLRPGEVLEAMAPEGRFGLMPDAAAAPRTVLGIAGGSGITPILSIAASLLAREPRARFVLLYGNRDAAGIMFRESLERLKDRYLSRLVITHVLSREKHELSALHGRLDAARITALLPGLVRVGAIDAAFLCGPEGMAEGARLALEGLGLDPARIQEERFAPAAGSPPRALPVAAAEAPPAAVATITVDGVTRDVPMASGESVLEAGLRAGLDLPWSCRGGMCCTCRAKVTEGAVAMATNYSLQPWETEAGFVLTCQSRPTGATVAVDYDAS
ncbi:2Fe-2S iron-sulfur cluster-binding protein [Falsiroseomonas stagni]|uniref:Ring-1,2-phenylacetyl-CoA epoxidase subunit PaaE n=1 Tax=Falsiroseomonas stagni DSM 19981 TaxID=1123062 RepID=A0A1I4A2X4_9PROT|nr:2Fe-2S iron-sulfur cluster-binding protein [Falsiroseomonas stagni]SFK50600.1 ring-1,2-phenylacetyl-CoA epoxidase subunit PaaE [Falsiroseomonas stagni DSM 19981]